ncbi:MAG: GDP-mannose 4,6-dehydratase [Chloroflexota bacterium]
MRILITGVGGFVGGHLLRHILETHPESELHGTSLLGASRPALPALVCHNLDLKNAQAVHNLIERAKPDQIYHLAAQASPRESFQNPWLTLENNIQSQLNILEACVTLKIRPHILIVSSGEIYGPLQPDQQPANEESPLRPNSPYGVSKITQDMMGLQYFLRYGLPIMRVRPFNHTGPGQREGFVAVDYAVKIAKIDAGIYPPNLEIRSPSAQRDFTDVRDVVRAYQMVIEQGTPGEVYNVASGQTHSINDLVQLLIRHSEVSIEFKLETESGEASIIKGDASRLWKATGWQPQIPFEQTLLDVLNDCRQRVHEA